MFPDFTCDTTWCLLALLGSVWSGIQNIKAQKWFEGFSWSDLESLSMKRPYVRASYSSEPVPVKQADTRTCGNPGAKRDEQAGHDKFQSRLRGGDAATDSIHGIRGSQDGVGRRLCHQRVSWPQEACSLLVFGARETGRT